MGRLPDRWMDYRPMGQVIPGTRFIAFKVPLKEALCQSLERNEWFTPQHIINDKPSISLIVDLTNTTRYYDKNVFQNANKSYVKIFCPGHIVPAKNIVAKFFESVDTFLSEHPDDETLIGVHCTHGVNRTGYFICKYMIDKMGINPSIAIEDVGRARGYPIERENYLQDLKGGDAIADTWIDPVRADNQRDRSPIDRSARNDRDRANWRGPVGPRNEYERFPKDRSAQNERDRANWRRDDGRGGRRDGRWNPRGDNPRYAREGNNYRSRSPRRFGDDDAGRSQSWVGRSRPHEQGPPRENSSERYNRPRSRQRYEDRPRFDGRPKYNDRPNYSR